MPATRLDDFAFAANFRHTLTASGTGHARTAIMTHSGSATYTGLHLFPLAGVIALHIANKTFLARLFRTCDRIGVTRLAHTFLLARFSNPEATVAAELLLPAAATRRNADVVLAALDLFIDLAGAELLPLTVGSAAPLSADTIASATGVLARVAAPGYDLSGCARIVAVAGGALVVSTSVTACDLP